MKIASVPWRWGQSWANLGSAAAIDGISRSTAGASRTSMPGSDAVTSVTTSLVSAGTGEHVT